MQRLRNEALMPQHSRVVYMVYFNGVHGGYDVERVCSLVST